MEGFAWKASGWQQGYGGFGGDTERRIGWTSHGDVDVRRGNEDSKLKVVSKCLGRVCGVFPARLDSGVFVGGCA